MEEQRYLSFYFNINYGDIVSHEALAYINGRVSHVTVRGIGKNMAIVSKHTSNKILMLRKCFVGPDKEAILNQLEEEYKAGSVVTFTLIENRIKIESTGIIMSRKGNRAEIVSVDKTKVYTRHYDKIVVNIDASELDNE